MGDSIEVEGSQNRAPSDVDSEGNKTDESSQFADIGSKSRENDLPEKAIEDSEGNSFLEGRLTVVFDRSVSEKDAHQIIEQRNGVWGDDTYNNDDGTGIVVVTAYFSGAKNYEDLQAIALDIAAQEGVVGADIDYTD